jgi:hypothetical protein
MYDKCMPSYSVSFMLKETMHGPSFFSKIITFHYAHSRWDEMDICRHSDDDYE